MNRRSEFYITDLGAVGDGITMNTAAIQAAVDACANEGGGTVVFPKGVFLSGTLQFRGGITYRLERGAVLKGSKDLADYYHNGFYHNELHQTTSLIWASGQQGVHITGDGCIDFSARDFFGGENVILYGEGIDQNLLTEKQIGEAVLKIRPRPTQPMFFESCRGVEIDGITLEDSPCWTITFSRSELINVHHIKVQNSLIIPNCDGVHLSACKDAIISDCFFNCGDDCVAITCITAEGEQDISERILVSRCHMRSRSAGVRIGHNKGKVRHVVVSDLVITDSNRGIAIFTGTGGYVEDVTVHDITMETRIVAGGWWGKGEAVVICAANSEGHIRDILIHDMRAYSQAGIIMAATNQNVSNVTLRNIEIKLIPGENAALYGGCLDFRPNLFLDNGLPDGQILYADGIENLVTENVRPI